MLEKSSLRGRGSLQWSSIKAVSGGVGWNTPRPGVVRTGSLSDDGPVIGALDIECRLYWREKFV